MGKYYSAAANTNAVTDSNSFAIANIDIIGFAFWFSGCVTISDVRISDREPDAGQVNTSAARAKRVLLMEGAALSAPFVGDATARVPPMG